ncbi:MAG: phosphoglycerate kinase [Bacteroidota bacterium]|nr:phosphoglycerate kinase [Bacteroidota bacterium]MDX5429539.1 phosphoglycerate kinase [Bacteroidota bacterium]MDX5468326.1 phosphoglycerate kinase [Bacteroidota bacterium]
MKTIDSFSFAGKRALIRVDFNVPLDKQTLAITDDARMRATLPTLNKILKEGGSCVLMSHLGRPKEGPEDNYSLRHLVDHLKTLTGAAVHFANDCIGEEAYTLSANLKAGEILLLENLRFYKEEEKGDLSFAEKLSKHGDIYVNDAFGTAHRAHASTAVIAQFFPNDKCFGYVMAKEVANAEMILKNAERPFTAIVGGAKVSDKLLILENLLNIADNIIVGGGMAYTFVKGMGGQIGNSLCEDDRIELTKELLAKAEAKGVKLLLPKDSVVADAFSNEANTKVADNMHIEAGWMGLDIGPEAAVSFKEVVKNSKTILWNGPMGVFEMSKFENGTKTIAEAVVEATQNNGAFSLIGGGDSAAAIAKFNYQDEVSYVSTGGGALLEYFEGKILPGVAAINE